MEESTNIARKLKERTLTERVIGVQVLFHACVLALLEVFEIHVDEAFHARYLLLYQAIKAAQMNYGWWYKRVRNDKVSYDNALYFLEDLEKYFEKVQEGLTEEIDKEISMMEKLICDVFVECTKIQNAAKSNKESHLQKSLRPLDTACEHAVAHSEVILDMVKGVKDAQLEKSLTDQFYRGTEVECEFCKSKVARKKRFTHGSSCTVAAIKLLDRKAADFQKWAVDRLPPTPKFNFVLDKYKDTSPQGMAEKQKNDERNNSIHICQFCKKGIILLELPRHQVMEYKCFVACLRLTRELRVEYEKEMAGKDLP